MPDGFSFPAGARVWIAAGSDYQITGAAFAPRLVARLAPAVSPDQARAALVRLEEARRPPGASPDTRAVTVTPLKAELVGGVRPTLWFLAAIVGVLLLVTCANVAGLLMSRLRVRHREFQLRTALGAGRGRLVRQLLAESLVLALVGGAVGLTLSGWAVRSYAAVATVPVPDIALDAIDLRFFAIGATMCLVSVLLFAIAPALLVGRRPAASVLREAATPGRHGRWLAHGLVVGQVAGAVLLLAATSAALAGAIRLARVETGITNDRVVLFEVELPNSRYADAAAASTLVDRFAERLTGHPDVARVGASDFAPGATHIGASTAIKYFGAPDPAPDTRRYASSLVATPDYFRAMGIGLLAGRTFDADDRAGSPRVAVVSASVARVLEPSGADVVGRQIPDLWGRPPQPVEIIGVVADVRLHFLSEGEGPQIYVPLAQQAPSGPLAIAVDAARSPSAALEAARSALAEIDAELPIYNVTPFADLRARYAKTELLTAEVSGIFGAIALALCAIGLYGVMSQAVAQRTRDIGIRMALGADGGTLRRQVVLHGLALAAAGTVVGAGCSLALSNAMARFVPGLNPPTASLIAVDVAILLLVAVAAAWVPARRASAVDPMVALRAE
jgi:putative ABC transport system permease protein